MVRIADSGTEAKLIQEGIKQFQESPDYEMWMDITGKLRSGELDYPHRVEFPSGQSGVFVEHPYGDRHYWWRPDK